MTISKTTTGNFEWRPNFYSEIGDGVSYHWHDWSHTVFIHSGLWECVRFPITIHEGGNEPVPDHGPGTEYYDSMERVMAAAPGFTPPGEEELPYVMLIEAEYWHEIKLVSKTIYGADGKQMEMDKCSFSCCWSYRRPDGQVVEYDTGWGGFRK